MSTRSIVVLLIIALLIVALLTACYFAYTLASRYLQTLDRNLLFVIASTALLVLCASSILSASIRNVAGTAKVSRLYDARFGVYGQILAHAAVGDAARVDSIEHECRFMLLASAQTITAYKSYRDGPSGKTLEILLKAMRNDLGVSNFQLPDNGVLRESAATSNS